MGLTMASFQTVGTVDCASEWLNKVVKLERRTGPIFDIWAEAGSVGDPDLVLLSVDSTSSSETAWNSMRGTMC